MVPYIKRISAVFLLIGTLQAVAGSTLPANLVDLVDHAERIFEGRCLEKKLFHVEIPSGKIPAVRYVFEVNDGLKGVGGTRVEVVQLGPNHGGIESAFHDGLVGMPRYEIGKSYLLFLNKKGVGELSAPVGLTQGLFVVENGQVFNGESNAHILWGMDQALNGSDHAALLARAKNGPGQNGLDKNAFKALVRDMMAGKIQAPARAGVVR